MITHKQELVVFTYILSFQRADGLVQCLLCSAVTGGGVLGPEEPSEQV